MNILVTGARGFVGRNLVENLKNIRDRKNKTIPNLIIDKIYEYDRNEYEQDHILASDDSVNICMTDIHISEKSILYRYCKDTDFVFNLAGVNRPKKSEEFMSGNFGFASELVKTLKACGNRCPVMLSSSIQASLSGRFKDSEYGRSKLAGEKLFFDYSKETGAQVLVYRFPNLFGKWCRPNYNSVVATFCYNIANDLPIQINDRNTELELLYIDDLVEEMLDALEGKGHLVKTTGNDSEFQVNTDTYYCVPLTYEVKLGEIADLLYKFHGEPETLLMPEIAPDSFEKKLYSTYLSYLPEGKVKFPLKMNVDNRGSFTELLKTGKCGQFSVNISKPGITKGQHWHNTKWEFFIVVSGHGLVQERKIGTDKDGNPYPVMNFEVSGEKIEAVHMLPGYTHNIINLSDTEDLVTLMWANEQFDPEKPDTFHVDV